MAERATIAARDERYCIAYFRTTLIQLWRTGTPLDGVEQAILAVARAEPPIEATVVVVYDGSTLPAPDARRRLDDLVKRLHPTCRCVAMVHEGQGFGAAAVRALVTGLIRVVKQPVPTQLFASVDDGVRWMQKGFPDLDGVGELASVVRALRADLDRRAPK